MVARQEFINYHFNEWINLVYGSESSTLFESQVLKLFWLRDRSFYWYNLFFVLFARMLFVLCFGNIIYLRFSTSISDVFWHCHLKPYTKICIHNFVYTRCIYKNAYTNLWARLQLPFSKYVCYRNRIS